jgi:cytochrome c-type biogenesis protein CcmH
MPFQFVAIVSAMFAFAAAFVLRSLWSGARRSARAVALVLPIAAVLLYAKIGNLHALDAKLLNAPPTLDQEIDALAAQMRTHPDNLDGWLLLGRSRKEQQRYADALDAFRRALKLSPEEPAIMVEIAETLALAEPSHRIDAEGLELLQRARKIDPQNQRALWFLGIAAYQQQHYAEAAATWEPLLVLAPESTRAALHRQIDDARMKAGMPPLPAETAASAGPALLRLRVDIAPELRAKLAPSDTLFVYARMPNGPPMPLAVKRIPATGFPIEIALADADGPMPTLRLSQQKTVDVQARVSHSGDALPQSGDFETTPLTAAVGSNKLLALTIDRVHP